MSVNVNANFKYSVVAGAVVVGVAHVVTLTGAHV